METKDRIKAILEYYDLSVKDFSDRTGQKTVQAVYDLLSGKTKSLSSSMQDKILSCFEDIDKAWLLLGEGEMIKTPQQQVSGNSNTAVNGNGNNVNSETATFLSLLQKKDEQIDRLLTLLEQKNK